MSKNLSELSGRKGLEKNLFEELGIEVAEVGQFKKLDTYLYKSPSDGLLGEAECKLISRSYRDSGNGFRQS